ncbi:MAG: hypothetical protein RSC34_04025, partial [Alistipes sp.]
ERSIKVIRRVLQLSDEKQKEVFGQVLRSYSQRHRSIVKVFERKNFITIGRIFDAVCHDSIFYAEPFRRLEF